MSYNNDCDAKTDSNEYFCENNLNEQKENVVPAFIFWVTGDISRKWFIKAAILTMLALFIGAATLLLFSDIFRKPIAPVNSDAAIKGDFEQPETTNQDEIPAETTSDVIEPVEIVQISYDFIDGTFKNVTLTEKGKGVEIKLKTAKIDFVKHIIADNFDSARSVHAVDIENDGDYDVLGAARYIHEIALWKNDGIDVDTGKIGFTKYVIDDEFQGAFSVHGADLDNDGYIDVIGASLYDEQIAWWKNNHDGTFSKRKVIDKFFDGAIFTYSADIDNNSYMDILAAGEANDKIAWWKNQGDGTFSNSIVIGEGFTGARSVHAADVDGDADIDVLGTARFADRVAWWENKGYGKEFIEHIIDDSFDGPRSVHATDLDKDGDIDVLAAARYSHQIALWDNDGEQNFTKIIIDDRFEGATNVYSADIDKDGGTDIIAAAVYANKIAWWQNKGNGQFMRFIIGEDFKGATFVYAKDINGDGYKDILVPAVFDNQIGLWINKPHYMNLGTFVSSVIEKENKSKSANLSWQGLTPENTNMRFQIRSADSIVKVESANWYGPYSTNDFYTASGSQINPIHNEHMFFQYRVFFETNDLLVSPSLNKVIINYVLSD